MSSTSASVTTRRLAGGLGRVPLFRLTNRYVWTTTTPVVAGLAGGLGRVPLFRLTNRYVLTDDGTRRPPTARAVAGG